MDLSLRKRSGDDQTFIAALVSLPGDDDTSGLVLVEEDLLNVRLLLLEDDLPGFHVPVEDVS